MRGFFYALGFLTRIPVPAATFGDERARALSLSWYPLVGALIGAVLCGTQWLLRDQPSLLSAAILLLVWVGLTGGLHLDGLADSADAWIGGMGDRERTLAIMKDPRCGPAGVTVLVLVLLLKFAALASFSPASRYLLLLSPLLGRAGLTLLFLTTPYVRSGGMGAGLASAPRVACWFAAVISAMACVAFALRGAFALFAAAVIFFFWRRACLRRLGGFTGDNAGALTEMVEAGVLLVLALA